MELQNNVIVFRKDGEELYMGSVMYNNSSDVRDDDIVVILKKFHFNPTNYKAVLLVAITD